MLGFFARDKKQVLAASETKAVLAHVKTNKKSKNGVDIIVDSEQKSDTPLDLTRLMAGKGKSKGKVALVLPLKNFELASVTVPPVAREAVAKMLPYSLTKVLDKPVTDYVYDWQVAQKFKERQELQVFLFSAAKFAQLQTDLQSRQKEIVWFEPDVFAACAYLQARANAKKDSTFLCLLIWATSISLAVFEDDRITLVRSVDIVMPEGQPDPKSNKAGDEVAEEFGLVQEETGNTDSADSADDADDAGSENEELQADDIDDFELAESIYEEAALVSPGKTEAETSTLDDLFSQKEPEPASDDILAGFGLEEQAVDTKEFDTEKPESEVFSQEDELLFSDEVSPKNSWSHYLDNLNLEIMRTIDYHSSVLKGKPIKEIFVGGAEHFFSAVESTVKSAQGIEIKTFPPDEIETKTSQTMAAICIGALKR